MQRNRIGRVYLALIAAAVAVGCERTAPVADSARQTIVLVSSADFGFLAAASGRVERVVKVRNESSSAVNVSRWSVSCDCLTIAPASIQLEPGESTLIALLFDPNKEASTGNFLMAVEGYSKMDRVAQFDVPASLVPANELVHLDEFLRARAVSVGRR